MPQLRLIKSDRPAHQTELELLAHKWTAELTDHSALTIHHYDWHIKRLIAWLAMRGCVRPDQITEDLLRLWSVSMQARWAASTRHQAIVIARMFLRWCRVEASETLKPPKVKPAEQRTITTDEVSKMLDICNDGDIGQRNAAIISLLYDSGLRAAELCRLRLSGLDLDGRELRVRVKGGAVMSGFYGERTTNYLRVWLQMRRANPGVSTLFVGIGGKTPGQQLTTRGLRVIVRDVGLRAGLSGVSPHAFRRGFAVALSAAGVPDNVLKDLGRWTDTGMIRRYTLAQKVKPLYRSPLDGRS